MTRGGGPESSTALVFFSHFFQDGARYETRYGRPLAFRTRDVSFGDGVSVCDCRIGFVGTFVGLFIANWMPMDRCCWREGEDTLEENTGERFPPAARRSRRALAAMAGFSNARKVVMIEIRTGTFEN